MRTKKLPQAIAELKDYRERNGLTYQELADRVGISRAMLYSWINGNVKPLDTSIRKIADFLEQENASQFVKQANSDKTYIDSRLVAQWSEKTHKNLLQDIRGYIKNLKEAQAKLSIGLKVKPYEKSKYINVFNPDYYFIESTYTHPINKQKLPCYLVTQRGCEMIANKMTGVKGTLFTALYINEFHRLRNEAEAIPAPQEAPQIEQESLFDNVPKTEDERDLAYLKQRLLDEMAKSTNVTDLGCNIVETLQIIQLLDKNKNKHK